MTAARSLGDTKSLIVDAIWSRQLAARTAELLTDEGRQSLDAEALALVERAAACCSNIADDNDNKRRRLRPLLEAAAISVDSGDATARFGGDLVRSVDFWIRSKDLDAALAVARDEGYMRVGGATSSADARHHAQSVLVEADDHDSRLVLRWERGTAARIEGRLRRLTHTGSVSPPTYVATPIELVEPLLRLGAISSADTVIDLGCGDGRVLAEAARTIGCRCRGVEQEISLVDQARANVAAASVDHLVSIESGAIEDADLRDVTVAFLFLPPHHLPVALERLRVRLGSGAQIIAHEHTRLEGVPDPDRVEPIIGSNSLTVGYLWTVA